MKAGWELQKLGELCRIRTGKKDVNQGNPEGMYPFFTCAAQHTFSDSYSFDTEALLIAGNGNVGQVSYYQGKFEAYQRTYVLSDFIEVEPRYLFLILDGKLKETVSKQKLGNTMPYIKVGMLKDFLVPIPPLPEQRRIVALLDEAFTSITTANTNAEKNLQSARALFESHLEAIFTERAEGWVERRIGDICTLKSGTSVSLSLEKAEGEIPYVKVSDMTYAGNESEIVGSSRYLDMGNVGKNAIFPAGTTIFPKRGGAIFTNKKRLTALPICADLNIMGVIPSGKLLPKLLYYYFLNIDMRLLGSGSSIPQINNYDIAPLKISFPEAKEEQEAILQTLGNLFDETKRLESLYQRKLQALDELKKSLLHQAFSGSL